MRKTIIAIVEDQTIFRQMLQLFIGKVASYTVSGTYENGKNFIEHLSQHPQDVPDIALIDIDMPEMNGIELNSYLHQWHPSIKTIMLSVHTNENLIASLIADGAASYLDKGCSHDELFSAIEAVNSTGFYINAKTLKSLTHAKLRSRAASYQVNSYVQKFSERELEVLKLICQQHTNAEIAEQLNISVRTVDGHRNNLLEKAGCRNTAGLVIFAIKNNIFNV